MSQDVSEYSVQTAAMPQSQHLIAYWENGRLILATRQVARTLEVAKAYTKALQQNKEWVFIESPFDLMDDLHPCVRADECVRSKEIGEIDWHYIRPR